MLLEVQNGRFFFTKLFQLGDNCSNNYNKICGIFFVTVRFCTYKIFKSNTAKKSTKFSKVINWKKYLKSAALAMCRKFWTPGCTMSGRKMNFIFFYYIMLKWYTEMYKNVKINPYFFIYYNHRNEKKLILTEIMGKFKLLLHK